MKETDESLYGWDLDPVDWETMMRSAQYKITDEEQEEINKQLREEDKGVVYKLKDLLNKIADYAIKYIDEPTEFTMVEGTDRVNPLEGEVPYILGNASFVHWSYKENGVDLIEEEGKATVRKIKKSGRLKTLYSIGSKVNLQSLLKGDILLFNNDKHMGIYIGNGEFVSMNGPSSNTSVGGVHKNNLENGYWKSIFQGHVLRLVR